MPKPLRVLLTDPARAVWQQLSPQQRDEALRLLRALAMAPEAGAFYRKDLRGRSLYLVSAASVHVIYRIHYRVHTDHLYVVNIDLATWTPPHVDMP